MKEEIGFKIIVRDKKDNPNIIKVSNYNTCIFTDEISAHQIKKAWSESISEDFEIEIQTIKYIPSKCKFMFYPGNIKIAV